mgnify:CR=1 FL=1
MSENLRLQLDRLPQLLAPHLVLTLAALGAGIALSLPVAVAIARRKAWRYPVLSVAGVVQTIPSLALLALMVPLLEVTDGLGVGLEAFGFWPAVIALTLYSVLPILRNTVTGITGVEPSLIEAGLGMGMTRGQMLMRVELPLAAPVILAGIRTAAVWVVGIATLATPVGQRCLGNFIFAGLQTRNWTKVMVGVAAAAGLAVVLDTLIAWMQRAAERRHRASLAAAAATLVVLTGLGLAWPHLAGTGQLQRTADAGDHADEAADLGTIRIGAKTFTEQYILAALVQRTLDDAGYRTRRIEGLGSTIIFDQLRAGSLDVYVDYSGTIWANYMKRAGHGSAAAVVRELTWWLGAEHGVRCLGPLGFENAYALAMRRDDARRLGIASIADLAAHAPELAIGGDYEFFSRPEWHALRAAYGLRFDQRQSFDATLMYEAVRSGRVDVIAAFSSDGRIAAYDLVVLGDPRQAIPPYDAVVLLGPRVADRPGVAAALQRLVGAIDLPTMQQANQRVDLDGQTPEQAAAALAAQVGDVR